MPPLRPMTATSPPKDGGRSARLAACPPHEVIERLGSEKLSRPLLDLFRTGSPSEKEALQGTLRSLGPEHTPLLCRALSHPEPEVRAAVAEVLGEIGDRTALEPLANALKASLVGRSAWLQVGKGVLLLLSVPVAAVASLALVWLTEGAVGVEALGWAFYGHPRSLLTARSRFGHARASIAAALARVVERHPTPEVTALLPELNLVSLDLIQQDGASRKVSREAIRRIEAVTLQIKNMPVAAAAPGVEEASLPRAAGAPQPEGASLPVATSEVEPERP